MTRKILILLAAMAAVALLIAGAAFLNRNSKPSEESSAMTTDLTEVIVVPSEMPGGISLNVPAGFEETTSAYYDKYYVKNDASVIITGEEIAEYAVDTEKYTEGVKKQYEQSVDDFHLSTEETFECSGTDCKLLEFTYSIKGSEKTQKMGCLTCVAVKDSFAYIITCKSRQETFAAYNNQFRQMFGSMKIADKENNMFTHLTDDVPPATETVTETVAETETETTP